MNTSSWNKGHIVKDYIYRCFGRSNSESDQIKRTFVNIYTKSAWDILKEYP